VIGISGAAKAWFDPSGLSLQRNVLRTGTSKVRSVAAAGTEFNWGLASLVGVPLSGILFTVSFRLPFLVLAVTASIMLIPLSYVLYKTVQDDDIIEKRKKEEEKKIEEGKKTSDNDQLEKEKEVKQSNFKTKLLLVLCSIPTMSNMFDATLSALLMSNKDFCFGLWLNQTHQYNQYNIARVSTIFGGADLLGEMILVVVLNKGITAMNVTQCNTIMLLIFGILFMLIGPRSDMFGLIVYFFISMCNEIKAVATLTIGAINNEHGLDGLSETSTYCGQAIGFTIGTLTAPLIWSNGQEIGVGVYFISICILMGCNHVSLYLWEKLHYSPGSAEITLKVVEHSVCEEEEDGGDDDEAAAAIEIEI